ncbi:hypothetical protein ETAA8_10950 [Anatilimnocola aggregata]|uniref:Transmembrane protein n=1 Tax=Anatilimnocola aggregata TaxID=2528021 RepID=A0A517Y713_9BACT|nr:hypothetical protein [Anatilimnocola aggregata]QDU26023.1 hypothetical protein ETAA8_10950 [Anatilimnocola aggregata]
MNENQVAAHERIAVRKIVWREVFPWLILLRVFRVAIAPGPLMLATGALALSSFVWWSSGFMFLTQVEYDSVQRADFIGWPYLPSERITAHIPLTAAGYLPSATGTVLQPYAHLTEPVRQLFDYTTPWNQVVYYLFGFLLSTIIWTFVGGVITRLALVELGSEQAYDWVDAVRYVLRRYLQYLLAPIAPLFALFGLGLLLVPLGWLMNLEIGLVIAGLVWMLVIVLGLVAAWLLVGLLFGWPLMIAAVGAKRDGDALQAFSEAFSYVYGKPLHYFFYAVVAVSLGALALTAVQLFAGLAVEFGFWGTAWGAGAERITQIKEQLPLAQAGRDVGGSATHDTGVWLIGLFVSLVEVVTTAAAFSYFFVSAAAIFLLLRKAVDDKEMDEVHLEDEDVHLETARRAMLSDDAPPTDSPGSYPVSPPKDEDVAE